jgi:hypothetical protein
MRGRWLSIGFRVTRLAEIFANWTIVNLGQLFGNNRSSPHPWTIFLHCKSYVTILKKNGLGYILGDFLTNSSGSPWLFLTRFDTSRRRARSMSVSSRRVLARARLMRYQITKSKATRQGIWEVRTHSHSVLACQSRRHTTQSFLAYSYIYQVCTYICRLVWNLIEFLMGYVKRAICYNFTRGILNIELPKFSWGCKKNKSKFFLLPLWWALV